MESYINVLIVNGYSHDEGLPSQYENVYVVNNWSEDEKPSHFDNVFVINNMRWDERPSTFYNILIWNGASDDEGRPSRYKNVYVVNFEVLKTIRSVRRTFYPSLSFFMCKNCLRHFENERFSLENWVRCPHCGSYNDKISQEQF